MSFKKSIVLFLVIFTFTSLAFSQTAEEIITKYIKVTGGEAKYQTVKTSISKGTFTIPIAGISMDLTVYSKQPDKQKIVMLDEASGMKVINSVNGEQGWLVDSFQGIFEPTQMDETTYKTTLQDANPDSFLFNREKNGYKVEYVGIEDKGTSKAHNIKITDKFQQVTNAFFDHESGLLLNIVVDESKNQSVISETRMSDYKDVNGLLLPHTVTIISQGMELTMSIDEIIHNPPIDDSIFLMPESK